METDETCLKQTNQSNLDTEIRKLRAEGKTYRQIAEILHVSIAKISRTLNKPGQKEETAPTQQGEMASKVFQLLEKGRTLSKIVIELKLEPEVVKDLYDKWVGLSQNDAKLPNLKGLNQALQDHIMNHHGLNRLLEKARNAGVFKKNNCEYYNDSTAECSVSPYFRIATEDDCTLICAFCSHFMMRREIVSIDAPQDPYQSYRWGQY